MSLEPPPLWHALARAWQFAPALSYRVWGALLLARWSQAVAFRQALTDCEVQARPQRLVAYEQFMRTQVTPAQVVTVMYALVQEGRLAWAEARAVVDQVLAQVDREGQWKQQKERL
jgi:hypothetical protein